MQHKHKKRRDIKGIINHIEDISNYSEEKLLEEIRKFTEEPHGLLMYQKSYITRACICSRRFKLLEHLPRDFYKAAFSNMYSSSMAWSLSCTPDAIKYIPRNNFQYAPALYWTALLNIDPTLSEFFDIAKVGKYRAYSLLKRFPYLYTRYDSLLKVKLSFSMWRHLLDTTDIEQYLRDDYKHELVMLKLKGD